MMYCSDGQQQLYLCAEIPFNDTIPDPAISTAVMVWLEGGNWPNWIATMCT